MLSVSTETKLMAEMYDKGSQQQIMFSKMLGYLYHNIISL